MQADEIRFLFGYDRWATTRILDVLDDINPAMWGETGVVGDRGLGSILVHHLAAARRWRKSFQGQQIDAGDRLERQALPTVDDLRENWEAEWAAADAWLQGLTDDAVAGLDEGIPIWQLLVHVVNHGTQHRSEAAAVLTAENRSPGELDLFDFAEANAGA